MIKELAVKYDVTATQIILGWGLARGVSLATRSSKELHRRHTLNVRFSVTPSLFLVVLKGSPVAPRLGLRRCEEDHSPRSQAVCILPARQKRDSVGLDVGAAWLGTLEAV